MQQVPLSDAGIWLRGAVDIVTGDQGVQPVRIPWAKRRLFEPPLIVRAVCPAGVRLSLVSDTARLEVDVTPTDDPGDFPPDWSFDLLVDGQRHGREHHPAGPVTLRFEDLPAGTHRLELYLSQGRPVRILDVRIDDGATFAPVPDDRPRWVVYGSSITQCGAAAGPSETWPAIVANRAGLDLTCLGYGGNCHLEPMVARMIRDLPADYISLCLGINTHNGSFSERTFRAMVIGLIMTIREKHPLTPIACVSPIFSPPRETTGGATGMTLQLMRQWIADAIDAIRQTEKDTHLHYIDGLSVFGPEHLHHMPDQLHPDAEGYRALAEQYLRVVMPVFDLPAPVRAR